MTATATHDQADAAGQAQANNDIESVQAELALNKAISENSPINIMLADTDLRITYANPASVKTLKTLEHLLPCTAEEIVGQCIDVFHYDSSFQRRILRA